MTIKRQGKYEGHHFAMTRRDYDSALADGRRFETVDGAPLATVDEVRAAMKKDREVISR